MGNAGVVSGSLSLSRNFEDYYKAGIEAYRGGDRALAHDLWREAATADPYQERVWLALLHVLETDEDRRVCLENVLAINPASARARRDLALMDRAAENKRKRRKLPLPVRFIFSVFRGIWIGIIASSIGVAVSILIYSILDL